jgi:hypothetical protein
MNIDAIISSVTKTVIEQVYCFEMSNSIEVSDNSIRSWLYAAIESKCDSFVPSAEIWFDAYNIVIEEVAKFPPVFRHDELEIYIGLSIKKQSDRLFIQRFHEAVDEFRKTREESDFNKINAMIEDDDILVSNDSPLIYTSYKLSGDDELEYFPNGLFDEYDDRDSDH